MKETFEVSHPLACELRPVMGKKTASKLLGHPIYRALAHPAKA
jgi:hypothetical protein